ncbi:MAG TPA: hypothetical protein VGM67_06345 [Gemmatimonadaceae bacterium]|jgi:uncharacterized protein YbjT (DUF2867 family)
MNVMLFGATGMVGQGVLRESLAAKDVQRVLAVGRRPVGATNPKFRDLVAPDLTKLDAQKSQLTGYDTCIFTLGVSAAGKSEEAYSRLTYDLTLGIAETLAALNPQMTFIYVSGTGTDSTEQGRIMWARVKGRTENALMRLPFKAAYMFRPGVIVPMDGIKSSTTAYRIAYAIMTPILPLLKRLFPTSITTTQQLGRAMLEVARNGYSKPILEPADITKF